MSEEVLAVPIDTELDALFESYVRAEQAPGLVYGLAWDDGLRHARGFGRFDSAGIAPDQDTVFPIASMSKSFSAAAALVARDRGLLSLDHPIDRYVPEFRLSTAGTEADGVPTLGMLLSMSGGLTEDNAWVDPFINTPTESLLQTVSAGVRLSRQAGTAYEYSNLGFALACLAVGRAAGRPFTRFLTDEVLVPLGLDSTFPDSAVPSGVSRALGHKLDSGGCWEPFEVQRSDAFAGAGGLVSSVGDLCRWITWLGAAFRPGDDDRVLSRMSRRELQRTWIHLPPVLEVGPGGSIQLDVGGYGLGLHVREDLHRGRVVSHSGGLPGFLLHMRWHPTSGAGIVVLTNSHRGQPVPLATEALGRVLARAEASAVRVELWPDTLALRDQADTLIRRWDGELAAQILAPNVDFDRPLSERRREIEGLVLRVGPLYPPRGEPEIIASSTPADVTWSIPGERGELICSIHLTPVEPPQIQEVSVKVGERGQPRVARTGGLGAVITPARNVEVQG